MLECLLCSQMRSEVSKYSGWGRIQRLCNNDVDPMEQTEVHVCGDVGKPTFAISSSLGPKPISECVGI